MQKIKKLTSKFLLFLGACFLLSTIYSFIIYETADFRPPVSLLKDVKVNMNQKEPLIDDQDSGIPQEGLRPSLSNLNVVKDKTVNDTTTVQKHKKSEKISSHDFEESDLNYKFELNKKTYLISTLTESEAEEIGNNISPEQLDQLRDIVLSPNNGEIKRHSYLYLLIQLKKYGARSLYEFINNEPIQFKYENTAHSSDFEKKNLELSLKIAALEALDNLATQEPEVKNYINKLTSDTNPSKKEKNVLISFLTSISKAGINNNNPGKLNRVLNAILEEINSL